MTTSRSGSPECALCRAALDDGRYRWQVCRACSALAVNAEGQKPSWDSAYDSGDNPVFIEGKQCWRRYRFGGFVTLLDPWKTRSLDDYHRAVDDNPPSPECSLPKAKKFVMFECIPKNNEVDESEMLFQYLRATPVPALKIHGVVGRTEFLELVSCDKDIADATHLHLSGHGSADAFHLPQGRVMASEFPPGCFKNKVVTLSACKLGGKDFLPEFTRKTGASFVVAATHSPDMEETAAFFFNFYYLLTHKRVAPAEAFWAVDKMLKGWVSEGFTHWSAAGS